MRPRPTLDIIKWTNVELLGLLEDEDSHVHKEKVTKHLALLPCHFKDIKAACLQQFDSFINVFDPELDGLVLAYKNPVITSSYGTVLGDSPFTHMDVDVDLYIFRPKVGQSLKGFVNKKGTNHIGVLVHKAFNVSIPQPNRSEDDPDGEDPPEWPANKVRVGQEIRFTLEIVDFKSRLPYMRGSLNEEDYLRGCQLFNEKIAASFNSFQLKGSGSSNLNGNDSSDETKEIKTENKRIVFNSASENETDPESSIAKKSIKKEKMKTPSKKRKRDSTSSEVESDAETQSSKRPKMLNVQQRALFNNSNDLDSVISTTPSKKKKKNPENDSRYDSQSPESTELNGTDDAMQVPVKKHKKKSSEKDKVNYETDTEKNHKATIKRVEDQSSLEESIEDDSKTSKKSKKRKLKSNECEDTEDERNYKLTIKKNLNHLLDEEESSSKSQKSKSRKKIITDDSILNNTDDERSYKKALKKVKVPVENGVSEENGVSDDSGFVVPKAKAKKKKKVVIEDLSLMNTDDEREYKSFLKPLVDGIKEESSKKKHKKSKKDKDSLSEKILKQESESSVDYESTNISFDE